ncbi:MAG: trigger factor [Phycisphaerales bacterium]
MATSTAPAVETPNIVKVEEIGPARKRLTITVPAATIDSKIEESFSTFALNATVPGFRKGKAPRALLERRVGDNLRMETKSQIVGLAYSQALEEHKIKPVGEPELDEATREAKLERGKDLTFSIDVEVVPTFDLPKVDGITIKKPVIDVLPEHTEAELKRTQYRFGNPERITGPFKPYDRMVAKTTVTKEGHDGVFFETDRALVVVPGDDEQGKGQVLGLLVEDLQQRLVGKQVGDTLELDVVGPESHEREDVRNAKLHLSLHVSDAERVTPATIAELVDRFGLGTEEVLREQLKLALEQRRDLEQRAAMREQLYEHLLGAVDFPLPENLSMNQVARLLERQRLELLYRGLEPEQVETQLAALRAGTEAQAKSRLKLFFILTGFAERMEIGVSEQEINGRVAAIARQRGERPEKVRGELANSGALNEVALQIREHKVADRLLDTCTVIDVPADEWNKAILAKQGRSGATTAAAKATGARADAKTDGKTGGKAEAKGESKPVAKAEPKSEAKDTNKPAKPSKK